MILDTVLTVLTAIFLLLSAFFSLAAAVGVTRFPDTLTRVHAGTKPQVFGLACILIAVILSTRNWTAIALAVLILLFQMLTTPAAAHMVGRAAYRAKPPEDELLFVDELEEAVELAHAESDAEHAAEVGSSRDLHGSPPDSHGSPPDSHE